MGANGYIVPVREQNGSLRTFMGLQGTKISTETSHGPYDAVQEHPGSVREIQDPIVVGMWNELFNFLHLLQEDIEVIRLVSRPGGSQHFSQIRYASLYAVHSTQAARQKPGRRET